MLDARPSAFFLAISPMDFSALPMSGSIAPVMGFVDMPGVFLVGWGYAEAAARWNA